jgi:hypothetical protein
MRVTTSGLFLLLSSEDNMPGDAETFATKRNQRPFDIYLEFKDFDFRTDAWLRVRRHGDPRYRVTEFLWSTSPTTLAGPPHAAPVITRPFSSWYA